MLLPLALAAWVYFPITRVYFYADDFVHLASIASDRAAVFLLSRSVATTAWRGT